MLIEIKDKGITFESPYTDATAAVEFRRLVEKGDLDGNGFAHSIYKSAKKHGSYTNNQLPWLHILIANHEGRATRPNAGMTGLQLVHEHLANCRKSKEDGGKGLLHPTIGLTVSGQDVVLKLAGTKSSHNGEVSVASDHRYGQGQFYGWIDDMGVMTSKGMPDAVKEILERVGQDPARVISEIGKESGRCCYCFAELTTVQSKIAGAGKRCSDNYGVPYPTAFQTRQIIEEDVRVLEGASDREKWEPQTV